VSANRVVASGWIGVNVVVNGAGQGRSVNKGILTGVIAKQRRTLTQAYDSTVV
jgi:hypothetical protein